MKLSNNLMLLCIIALGTTGCSAVRGELVETGMTSAEASATSPLVDLEPEANEDGIIEIGSLAISEPFAFTAPEIFSGAVVSGTELYYNSPMIVTFVSPTCAVCIVEGPEIAQSAEDNPEVTFLVIHSGDTNESYQDYADTLGLYQENVIHVEDENGVIWKRFGITSTPSSLLVDADGRVSQSKGALELQGQEKATEVVLTGLG